MTGFAGEDPYLLPFKMFRIFKTINNSLIMKLHDTYSQCLPVRNNDSCTELGPAVSGCIFPALSYPMILYKIPFRNAQGQSGFVVNHIVVIAFRYHRTREVITYFLPQTFQNILLCDKSVSSSCISVRVQ